MGCLPEDNVISYDVVCAVEIIIFQVEKSSKSNSNVAGMKVAVKEKLWQGMPFKWCRDTSILLEFFSNAALLPKQDPSFLIASSNKMYANKSQLYFFYSAFPYETKWENGQNAQAENT